MVPILVSSCFLFPVLSAIYPLLLHSSLPQFSALSTRMYILSCPSISSRSCRIVSFIIKPNTSYILKKNPDSCPETQNVNWALVSFFFELSCVREKKTPW
ncbi:MAG: hypothetical protein JOS17DRAFT_437933 [Linnemannia elongata]|nr:MAG: hypothetical protein JOS17DRAFT_437933 [Linnemannia elongata]